MLLFVTLTHLVAWLNKQVVPIFHLRNMVILHFNPILWKKCLNFWQPDQITRYKRRCSKLWLMLLVHLPLWKWQAKLSTLHCGIPQKQIFFQTSTDVKNICRYHLGLVWQSEQNPWSTLQNQSRTCQSYISLKIWNCILHKENEFDF